MKNSRNFENLREYYDYYQESFNLDDLSIDTIIDNTNNSSILEHSIESIETDNYVLLSFLQYEDSFYNYWEDDDRGQLIIFANLEEATKTLTKIKKEKKLFYLIDKYSHGNVHYSIENTVSYPDRQWEVSSKCGVFVPSDSIQEEFKVMRRKHGEVASFIHFIESGNKTLDEYSDYCNGDIYSCCVKVYNKKSIDIISQIEENFDFSEEEENTGALVGYKNAEEYQQNLMNDFYNHCLCSELEEHLIIETNLPNDIKILLSNDMKINFDSTSYQYTSLYNHHVIYCSDQSNQDNQDVIYVYKDNLNNSNVQQLLSKTFLSKDSDSQSSYFQLIRNIILEEVIKQEKEQKNQNEQHKVIHQTI